MFETVGTHTKDGRHLVGNGEVGKGRQRTVRTICPRQNVVGATKKKIADKLIYYTSRSKTKKES